MNPEKARIHNTHVPIVLQTLFAPQAAGQATLSGTLVITESVLLGVLLACARQGKSPQGALDEIYTAAQQRLEAEIAKGTI